jgi:hypothetical protein
LYQYNRLSENLAMLKSAPLFRELLFLSANKFTFVMGV